MPSDLARLTLLFAQSQINVREKTGNNDGPDVEKYQRSTGNSKGDSWCMSFVYWSVDMACKFFQIPNPLVKTGGVLDQYNRTKLKKTNTPEVGAIGILDLGGGHGHTFLVEAIRADGLTLDTLEGNTGIDGSANGIGVFERHVRKISSVKSFIILS